MGENIYKSCIWWKSSIQNIFKNTCNSVTKRQLDLKMGKGGFPGGAVVENLPANAGDMGSSPGLGRSHMPQSG